MITLLEEVLEDAKHLITVDPGTNKAGWAVWEPGGKLQDSGFIRAKAMAWTSKDYWWDNALRVSAQFARVANRHHVDYALVELPQYYDSFKGIASARKQSMPKLSFSTGAICMGLRLVDVKIHMIPPHSWKGQMPKSVMRKIVVKILGRRCQRFKEDEWDAVAMGLFVYGRFKIK